MSGFILFLETFFGQFFYGGFWKAVGSGILFGASWLFGSFDIALQAMLVALFLDFGIGLWKAIYHGKFCKEKFQSGLEKDAMYAVVLIAGHMADFLIFHKEMEFGFQNFFVAYIGISELISVLKHLTAMGLKIPAKIINRLEKAKDNLDVIK